MDIVVDGLSDELQKTNYRSKAWILVDVNDDFFVTNNQVFVMIIVVVIIIIVVCFPRQNFSFFVVFLKEDKRK